jgi:hypothetical protein
MLTYDTPALRQTGSRNLMGPKTLPTIWGTYMKLATKYMHIFRHILLSNNWWQRSDIWSQASYRYPISWEAFLDPSDSYFLFADFVDFSTHWTYMLIFCRIFLSNYPKTLPTIWGTYMKLVTKYQISVINSCWEKCDDSYFLFADLVGFYTHWTYMHIFRHIFLSNYWWQRSDIWLQASYRYAILWVAFLDPNASHDMGYQYNTKQYILFQLRSLKGQ